MSETKKKLTLACRILYMEGLADFHLGHMSGRTSDPEKFYMKPNGLGLEEIRPEDLLVMDGEGRKLEGIHPPHGETPIHSEIYKKRRDVQAIVHVHPPPQHGLQLCTDRDEAADPGRYALPAGDTRF